MIFDPLKTPCYSDASVVHLSVAKFLEEEYKDNLRHFYPRYYSVYYSDVLSFATFVFLPVIF